MTGETQAGGTGVSWSEADVLAALDLPAQPGTVPLTFTGITTDSRVVTPGALFVALPGERFDGHDYLAAVAAAGASGAVVRTGTDRVANLRLFPVEDTLVALGRLARARRRQIAGPVIAITGTNGKTSSKEMIAAVLGTRYRVHATRANLNNLIGVPLTILESSAETDALVVEAGANMPGEISRAGRLSSPISW